MQTYQLLTNDDEACIPSLSSIILAAGLLSCTIAAVTIAWKAGLKCEIHCFFGNVDYFWDFSPPPIPDGNL